MWFVTERKSYKLRNFLHYLQAMNSNGNNISSPLAVVHSYIAQKAGKSDVLFVKNKKFWTTSKHITEKVLCSEKHLKLWWMN